MKSSLKKSLVTLAALTMLSFTAMANEGGNVPSVGPVSTGGNEDNSSPKNPVCHGLEILGYCVVHQF